MEETLQDLVKKLKKEKVPCFIFLVSNKEGKPKFIEVIIKRPYRYTEPMLIKKVPKTYKGIKVKVL